MLKYGQWYNNNSYPPVTIEVAVIILVTGDVGMASVTPTHCHSRDITTVPRIVTWLQQTST